MNCKQVRLGMNKFAVEEALAKHFIQYLTHEALQPVSKPDAVGQASRLGGQPDYVFLDTAGRQYVLELTRLLAPKAVRQLEQFLIHRICWEMEGRLPGTYLLQVDADQLPGGKIQLSVAQQCVSEISALVNGGHLGDQQSLKTGLGLRKVRDDGSRLVPWITAGELPFDLTPDHPVARELQGAFEAVVAEGNRKLRGYSGRRILLIDISQSGLDWEFHAQTFRNARGVVLIWIEGLKGLPNIDEISLHQMRVWQPPEMKRVLAGHRYVDQTPSYYHRIWPRVVSPVWDGRLI